MSSCHRSALAGLRWAAALLLAALGCADEESFAETWPDHWHVSGGFVRDADGRAVILRGMNLAGAHKAPPYFGFHQPEDFARIRDEWAMNSIRLLVSWAAIEPAEGAHDPAYLDAVAQRVEWAEEAGLLVVLDMHQDLYGEGFGGDGAPRWSCDQTHYDAYEPVSPWFMNYTSEHIVACYDGFWSSASLRGHYIEAWRLLAARLADSEGIVGFDIMNEPYFGSMTPSAFETERLTPLYENVVSAVRAEAPGWVAFLEPSAARNLGVRPSLGPFTFGNRVYAPHCYDPAAESGEGFDPAGRDGLIYRYELMAEEATELGAALWIGEYGGIADDPGIVAYMDAQYDGAASRVAGSAYWAYDRDDGYGLLRPDGSEKTELTDVLVRPYPERVAGTPLSCSYDEGSRTFRMSLRTEPRVSAPTLLSVPDRVYPEGVQVECGGCAVERRSGSVLLRGLGEGAAERTILLRP